MRNGAHLVSPLGLDSKPAVPAWAAPLQQPLRESMHIYRLMFLYPVETPQ